MNPFDIKPEKLGEELLAFNDKLVRGINTLTEIG
jgi:hypothetical protein